MHDNDGDNGKKIDEAQEALETAEDAIDEAQDALEDIEDAEGTTPDNELPEPPAEVDNELPEDQPEVDNEVPEGGPVIDNELPEAEGETDPGYGVEVDPPAPEQPDEPGAEPEPYDD